MLTCIFLSELFHKSILLHTIVEFIRKTMFEADKWNGIWSGFGDYIKLDSFTEISDQLVECIVFGYFKTQLTTFGTLVVCFTITQKSGLRKKYQPSTGVRHNIIQKNDSDFTFLLKKKKTTPLIQTLQENLSIFWARIQMKEIACPFVERFHLLHYFTRLFFWTQVDYHIRKFADHVLPWTRLVCFQISLNCI